MGNVHTRSTSSDFPAFPEAVKLPSAVRLRLAHHIVIVVGFASRPNKVRGAHQRCRSCPELCHLRNIIGERSGVQKDLLIESTSASVTRLRKYVRPLEFTSAAAQTW